MTTPYRKKLIEVALPLEAINREAAREKSIRHGHPSTLHLWWARRPLAACRAVIFASLVDDPSSRPDLWPTVEAQEKKRQELFRLIEELVKWENSNNEEILNRARKEILDSTDGNPPAVYDPFCGGGSIPLEAQRLGLEAHASDLNPVPVLITKALIELPAKFSGQPPVNPEAGGIDWSSKGVKAQKKAKKADGFGDVRSAGWKGAAGLAEDIRYYGRWMRDEAERRIGKHYPKVHVVRTADESYRHAAPEEMAAKKSEELTVIAWLWARTVNSPNPAARGAHVPLMRSFLLSSRAGKRAWVEPVVDAAKMTYRFDIRTGVGEPRTSTVGRNGGVCLLTDSPIPLEYVREEGKAGRLGARLVAIVADGRSGRIYLPPCEEYESVMESVEPNNVPDTDLPEKALSFRVQTYGMTKHRDLFTKRQLTLLTTLCSLVDEARDRVAAASLSAGLQGEEASVYSIAVATYLGLGVSKVADYNSTLVLWSQTRDQAKGTFTRHALPMVWDFAEVNPFAGAAGDFQVSLDGISRMLKRIPPMPEVGRVRQVSATDLPNDKQFVFSTDPPYYDNIGYADLSDFFYVWLRLALSRTHPNLFDTMLVPKKEELIATPFRFDGDSGKAKVFFEEGLSQVFSKVRLLQDQRFPLTIFYAFKQSEEEVDDAEDEAETTSRTSSGWETILQSLIEQGFQIDGTWPLRTERGVRTIGLGTNALASSIVLVCRPRPSTAPIASRREFLANLRRELPDALRLLQKGNIAPVDLAQAAIGPGMAVFSRHTRVMETDGETMGVRTALALINATLDEVLAEQEGEFDVETRWAIAWFDQYGFSDGPFGVAETLCTAKNTAVSAMAESGILFAKAGKVRLLRTDELDPNWDPNTDKRFTIWEATHHLVRALDARGEDGAADLNARLGGARAELARDLSYRLYTICERRKWSKDALQYNALVQAWPEATRLAAAKPVVETFTQREML